MSVQATEAELEVEYAAVRIALEDVDGVSFNPHSKTARRGPATLTLFRSEPGSRSLFVYRISLERDLGLDTLADLPSRHASEAVALFLKHSNG